MVSTLALIDTSVTLRTVASLTRTMTELITSGQLAAHAKLPTVRAAAEHLGMSRSAVGQAWRNLQYQGLVESRRRGGTFVLPSPTPPHAKRFESMIRSSTNMSTNLGNLWCDGLPEVDLTDAFTYAVGHPDASDPYARPIHPEFQAVVEASWPFETSSFLAMHGNVDTLEMTLSALVQPGDHVAVESPTFSRIFDILESLGAIIDPIPLHSDGPDLKALAKSLISKPVAFLYQPNRSLPTGRSVTRQWVAGAADILRGSIPIIELDQVWPLMPVRSLGAVLPEQVLHARGFHYAFGSGMRLAVTGGNPALTNILWNKLSFSSRYVSPLMQLALAHLLSSTEVTSRLDARTDEIQRRHDEFSHALRRRGHDFNAAHAPMIWLPVPDEHSVCTQLSTRGILVHPGAFFNVSPAYDPHICINAAAVGTGIDALAEEITAACHRPETFADS